MSNGRCGAVIRSRTYPRVLAVFFAACCVWLGWMIGLSDWRQADLDERVSGSLLAGFGLLVCVRTWLAAAWFDSKRRRLVYRGVLCTVRIPYSKLVSLGLDTSLLLPRLGFVGAGVPCYVRKGFAFPVAIWALGSYSHSMSATVIIDLNEEIKAAGLEAPPVWVGSYLSLQGMSAESLGSDRGIKHWWTADPVDEPVGTIYRLRLPRRVHAPAGDNARGSSR